MYLVLVFYFFINYLKIYLMNYFLILIKCKYENMMIVLIVF